MMKFSFLTGALRVVRTSLIFMFTTLATLLASGQILSFLPKSPWSWEYAPAALVGVPLLTFYFALCAFASFGASGASGADPSGDLQDVFRRIFFKHVLNCIWFLVPQVLIETVRSISPYVGLVSTLFVIPMIAVSQFVDQTIVERVRHENLKRFVNGVGTPKRVKRTKGVRRR